jgi:hypothetical protein
VKAFVRQTHFYKHHTLDITRKISLTLFYLFSLISRTGSIIVTLNLPVLMNNDFMQEDISPVDFSQLVNLLQFRNEFMSYYEVEAPADYSGRRFSEISNQMITCCIIIATTLLIHIVIFTIHAFITVPMFRKASCQYKVFTVGVNLFLMLPFRTPDKKDFDEDSHQEWFLIFLHPIENVILVSTASLHYYLEESFNYAQLGWFLLIFLLPLILANIAAIFLFWHYKENAALLGNIGGNKSDKIFFKSEVRT